jgi:hypothetical protein
MRTIERTPELVTIEVNTNELVSILKGQMRGTFANFEIHTIPSMNKTNNPFYNRVTKVTKGNILIGGDYQKRVSNETNNPNFVPEKCNVGEHIGDGNCVIHNEKLGRDYLQYEWFEEVLPKSEFFFEGNPIEKQLFVDYMTKKTFNKYGVNIQSVKIENIKKITMNHTRYIVVEE